MFWRKKRKLELERLAQIEARLQALEYAAVKAKDMLMDVNEALMKANECIRLLSARKKVKR